MEVYKKFTDALNSIDPMIIYWEFPESNEIYDRNALLNLSDKLEQIFNPEGADIAEIRRYLIADHRVHDALLPGDPDDFPRIHAAQARNAFGDKIIVQRVGGAEI